MLNNCYKLRPTRANSFGYFVSKNLVLNLVIKICDIRFKLELEDLVN